MVLELQVPEEELFQRLAGRGRADDKPEVIRQRLVAYRKQTEPLLDYYRRRGLLQEHRRLGDRGRGVWPGPGRLDQFGSRAAAGWHAADVPDDPRWRPQAWKSFGRREKSPRCARPGLLVWEAFQLARPMVRPGVTTGEIDAAIEQFFAEQQAEPLFKNYPNSTEGGPPFPAVTCISINREVVHGIPGKRKLVEGDIVSIDTGCKLTAGAAMRRRPCRSAGRPPRASGCWTSPATSCTWPSSVMGQRKWWSEVAEEMQEFVRKAGFSVVEDFVGHGIGRSMHEDPQVPNFVKRGFRRGRNDFRLVPGLVIAVEPMVNMGTKEVRMWPDQWTQVTADGVPSAHFEHTVAITESGTGRC